MSDERSELESPNEKRFYSEFKTFAEGQEWQNRQKKLIPQNDLGSVIDPRESAYDKKMSRLAGIHNRQSRSVEDPEKNQIINRYNYLDTQFHWLEEYIPINKLDQILQLMAYSRTQRKIAKGLAGLNLQDLALILAFWELDVYPLGNYIVEEVLQDINEYLRTFSNDFMIRGIISVKDIQLAQEAILSDLYAMEFKGKEPKIFSDIPKKALSYYRNLLYSFEADIPKDFAEKIAKARSKRPELIIPSSVYIWVIRKKLLLTMLPFLVAKVGAGRLNHIEFQNYSEHFWNSVFHQKALGDLPTIGFLLIETWQEANKQPLPVRLTSLHKVEKFKTRIKAYRRRFKELMVAALPDDLKTKKSTRKTKQKTTKKQKEMQDRIITLTEQVGNLKKWIDQFISPTGQKLVQRSAALKEAFDENQKAMITLQQELTALQVKVNKSENTATNTSSLKHKALQTKLFDCFTEILDIYKNLLMTSSAKSVKTKRLLQLEETILPDLERQIQAFEKEYNQLLKSDKKSSKEAEKSKNVINQVKQHYDLLSGALKQKIEDEIKFHLINSPAVSDDYLKH